MRIVVGLSGGVDSSVAAAFLKEQGHEVIGVTMQLCNPKHPIQGTGCFCMSQLSEIETAKRIAEKLGIEHHVIDCSTEYRDTILKYVDDTYLAGKTPNPCIWCNANFKFGLLPKLAERVVGKFDKFATGHYAKIVNQDGCFILKKAVDEKKDQSYFLSRLTQKQLSNVMFPLGEFTKDKVREIAAKYELETAAKKDSQDFYSGDIHSLISREDESGDVVDLNGVVRGTHRGYWHYTIGQRRGIHINSAEPMYVIDIDPKSNRIIVGTRGQAYSSSFKIENVVWHDVLKITYHNTYKTSCKVRSMGNTYSNVWLFREVNGDGTAMINAGDEKIFGITKGQEAVFYIDDSVVASGVIA